MYLPANITLEPGDSGDYVKELQRRLMQRDLLGETNITGFYDGITTNAVKAFQSLNGLKMDGIAGPDTIRRLLSFGAYGDNAASGSSSYGEDEEKEYSLEREDVRQELYESAGLTGYDRALSNDAVRDPLGEQDGDTPEELRARGLEEGEQDRDQGLWRYSQEQQQGSLEHEKLAEEQLATRQMQRQLDAQHEHFTEQQAETREQLMARDGQEHRPDRQGLDAQQAFTREQTVAQDALEAQQATTRDQMVDQGNAGSQNDQEIRIDPNRLSQERGAALGQQNGQQNGQVNGAQAMRDASGQLTDPSMRRTEAQLNGASRTESQQEGQHLQSRGVRDIGLPPDANLGELTPAQTPTVGRGQELGMS